MGSLLIIFLGLFFLYLNYILDEANKENNLNKTGKKYNEDDWFFIMDSPGVIAGSYALIIIGLNELITNLLPDYLLKLLIAILLILVFFDLKRRSNKLEKYFDFMTLSGYFIFALMALVSAIFFLISIFI